MENIKLFLKLYENQAARSLITVDSFQQLLSTYNINFFDWINVISIYQSIIENEEREEKIASSSSSTIEKIEIFEKIEKEKEEEKIVVNNFKKALWKTASTVQNLTLTNCKNLYKRDTVYRWHLKENMQETDKEYISEWIYYLYLLSKSLPVHSVLWSRILSISEPTFEQLRSSLHIKNNPKDSNSASWFTVFSPLFLRDILPSITENNTPDKIIVLTACDHSFSVLLSCVFPSIPIISHDPRPTIFSEKQPNITYLSGALNTLSLSISSEQITFVFVDSRQLEENFDFSILFNSCFVISTLPVKNYNSIVLLDGNKYYVLGENRDSIAKGKIFITHIL